MLLLPKDEDSAQYPKRRLKKLLRLMMSRKFVTLWESCEDRQDKNGYREADC